MDWISWLQWPAFVASVGAAWLVASNVKSKRNIGFWVFLASNALWGVWGLYSSAWALIALQVCLAAMNLRGLRKTDGASPQDRWRVSAKMIGERPEADRTSEPSLITA